MEKRAINPSDSEVNSPNSEEEKPVAMPFSGCCSCAMSAWKSPARPIRLPDSPPRMSLTEPTMLTRPMKAPISPRMMRMPVTFWSRARSSASRDEMPFMSCCIVADDSRSRRVRISSSYTRS